MVTAWLACALFFAGAFLLGVFVVRTALPAGQRALDDAARRHARTLQEEFLDVSPRRAKLLAAGACAAAACGVYALTGAPLWAAAAAGAPALLSGAAVQAYVTARRRRIVAQLPAFLDLLAGHLKAWHSAAQALLRIEPSLPRWIREEVGWVVRLHRLGTPLPRCLEMWEERLPVEELSLVARPLAAALPAGGNVVELLVRTRDVLRARARARERLLSLTAQARLQAVVLSLLPPAFVAGVSAVDPRYLPAMLGTFRGRAILILCAVLEAAGWLVMRRILAEEP